MLDSKIIKAHFIVNKINEILEKKWITKTKLAENMWVSQPAVTPFLNLKRIWTDDFYKKMLEAIPLTELEIKKVFQKADEEEYRYKYWKEINNLPLDWIDLTDFEKEELWKILFSKVVWVEPTKEDVEVMLEMIRMSNRNKK